MASILKSLEHEFRYDLIEVLSRQPQPTCMVFDELNATVRKRAAGMRCVSFSSLAFHLSILERNRLVRMSTVLQGTKSPKGYPIRTECNLTPLGLYVKRNLPSFMQCSETMKRLSGNTKSRRGWFFAALTFLSIASAYNERETRIEVAKLKSMCKGMNAYYYLRGIERKNRWLLINKIGHRKCVEIDYVPEELTSSMEILNSMRVETSLSL